jgi:hypothetical protein
VKSDRDRHGRETLASLDCTKHSKHCEQYKMLECPTSCLKTKTEVPHTTRVGFDSEDTSRIRDLANQRARDFLWQ